MCYRKKWLICKLQVSDIQLNQILNNVTGRNDDPWWEPIIEHNKRVEATKHAQLVNEKYRNSRSVDFEAAIHIAKLINNDTIDLDYFEHLTSPIDENGHRSSLRSIKLERRVRERIAVMTLHEQHAGSGEFFYEEMQHSSHSEDLTSMASTSAKEGPSRPQLLTPSRSSSTETIKEPESEAQDLNLVATLQAHDIAPPTAPPGILDQNVQLQVSESGRNEVPGSIPSIQLQPATPKSTTPQPGSLQSTTSQSDVPPPTISRPADLQLASPQIIGQEVTGSTLRGQQLDILQVTSSQFTTPQPEDPSTRASDSSLADDEEESSLASESEADFVFNGPLPWVITTTDGIGNVSSRSQQPILPMPPNHPTSNMNLMKWAYVTHTDVDQELAIYGAWLYPKPVTYFIPQDRFEVENDGSAIDAAVFIAPSLIHGNTSSILFDGYEVLVIPHSQPFIGDIRSINIEQAGYWLHPDWLNDTLLSDYQAVEMAGFNVWRHDRNLLRCRLCAMPLSDKNPATIICLGCGPKSLIRYCSREHQIADLQEHGEECGSKVVLMTELIDQNTEPARFSHFCPHIRDRTGRKNFYHARQRLFAQFARGRYSLFDPATGEPTTLVWEDKYDDNGVEIPYPGYMAQMEGRIERLLNLALFDHRQVAALEYLYRLIQHGLKLKGGWPASRAILNSQFLAEFNLDVTLNARIMHEEPLCECEWSGPEAQAQTHHPACRFRAARQGELFRGLGVKQVVEAQERAHWVLRAWRQRFEVPFWTDRAMGRGFPGCQPPESWAPKLGPGWVGWGAEPDDVVV